MAEKIVICANCNTQLSLDEQYVGMELECPVCKKTFIAQLMEPAENDTAVTEKEPETEVEIELEPLEQPQSKSQMLLGKLKSYAQEAQELIKQNTNDYIDQEKQKYEKQQKLYQSDEIEIQRELLRDFFAKIQKVKIGLGIVSIFASIFEAIGAVFFIFKIIANPFSAPPQSVVHIFNKIKAHDWNYLDNLDVLPRYGKSSSQLVTEAQSLYSPNITESDDNDEPDFKFTLCKSEDGDDSKDFIYSTEEVIKLFTFENQLFVFTAIWDYTVGKLFSESTEAFFFVIVLNFVKNIYNYQC